jgi:lysosomal Pro-X carboxypeptidase
VTTTLAAEMGALVVFGEHRYFGSSFPFEKEDAFKEGNNSYLTVENTMMDYVELIKYIKVKYDAQDKAVITFGGSYGGMLAAWLRMKFPHVFQGALAASAPLVYFKDSTTAPEDEFSMIATQDFNNTEVGPICAEGIKYALEQLNTSDATSYDTMNSVFMPCDDITTAEQVYALTTYLSNGFLYMAMTDYPYESSFLEPMPGFPVNASCAAFSEFDPDHTSKSEAWAMLKTASDTYFNYTGQITCSNINDTDATGNLDGAGWNILACN